MILSPADHGMRLTQLAEDGSADELAGLLGPALGVMLSLAGAECFNFVIHEAPAGTASFHWHMHLISRGYVFGGFEFATGMSLTAVSPEQAAADLRPAISSQTAAPGAAG